MHKGSLFIHGHWGGVSTIVKRKRRIYGKKN